MARIHKGSCGPHMNGHMLAKNIIRQGYFRTTMEIDCVQMVQHCERCQFYANPQHVPPHILYSTTTPWPFATWAIDIIS